MKSIRMAFISFLFVMGCASTTPKNVYLPMETSKTIPFFRDGIPIAAGYTDSTIILTSMDAVWYVGGMRNIICVWLLFRNASHTPFLLKPLEHITFTYEEVESGKSTTLTPISPTKLAASIQNEKTLMLMVQAIGGTLKSMSAEPTTFTDSYGYSVQANDLAGKQDVIIGKTADAMATTAFWYDIYRRSTYASVLKKNTLFTNQAVNGFVYFEVDNVRKFTEMKNESEIKRNKYKYTLSINTPNGMKNITFKAIPGE